MPRGRPKKDDDDGLTEPTRGLVSTLSDLPPQKIKGEPNPDYYAELLDLANRKYIEDTLMNGGKSDFNYAQFQKGVLDAAKMSGLDERSVLDRRSEIDKAADAAADLRRCDRSALELLDAEIDAIKNAMDLADEKCKTYIDGKQHAAEGDPAGPKAWRDRLEKIRSLKERAREALPSHRLNQYVDKDLIRAGLEAAHLLRFMIYVGRTHMDTAKRFSRTGDPSAADYVYDVGDHHAKLAADIWIARNGVHFAFDKVEMKPVIQRGIIPYKGIIALLPVGHGKTDLCNHLIAFECATKPKPQVVMLHAVFDIAKQNLADVKGCFGGDSDKRRRFRALYPKIDLADYHNDSTRMRLNQRNPTKSPSITAAGVTAAKLGIDSNLQVWDDIVPREDADQPTERESRWKNVQGTFATRQRGQNTFTVIVGTPWHASDVLMRMIEQAKLAARTNSQQGICYLVSIQRCGGPKTSPAWKPLWPKIHNVFELKAKYNELGPSLYAAAMMMNPLTEEQRIVKKLRLYDPEGPEHASFLANSTKYVSLDPAATKESKSDKAGIVYAGFGDVRVSRLIDGVETVDTEKRVRFITASEIHATQSELTEYVYGFAKTRPVDYVLAEAVAGFKGIIEMFEGVGIDAIALNPRGKSKETRLRGVAPILEDASAELGFRAVAEFPGVRNEKGELELHPMFKSVAEQILDFGVCAKDHALDAVSQMLGYLAPDLGVGRGIVSRSVAVQEKLAGDPRLIAIYKEYERAEKSRKHGQTEMMEDEWMRSNWR